MRISETARFECDVNVLQQGQWARRSSLTLVPGDVVEVEDESVVPCDLALLDGGCVVNEAMLTGESVPVVKGALDLDGRAADESFELGRFGFLFQRFFGDFVFCCCGDRRALI